MQIRPAEMLDLNALYGSIAPDLDRMRNVFAAELDSDQAFIADLCRHVSQFHGKMLRPALVYLTARSCGDRRPAHDVLAAVVEMVHIATLIHDDILDDADMRRRAPTVNRLVGNERAVLLGDFLISHAFHLCSSLDSQYASRLIGRTTNEVCEGEMMQVANRDNFDLSESLYFDIIERKTASLIGACCELGARYAGAEDVITDRMRRYGRSVGIAFQIIDDLLDLTGDETEAGKTLGRDVHKGKLTLPLIHFLATAAAAERDRLRELLAGDERRREQEVASLLADSPSLDYARAAAARYIRTAHEAIAVLPASDSRDTMAAMAEYVLSRRR